MDPATKYAKSSSTLLVTPSGPNEALKELGVATNSSQLGIPHGLRDRGRESGGAVACRKKK